MNIQTTTSLVLSKTEKHSRAFYVLVDNSWQPVDFGNLKQGDRIKYIENHVHSNVWIVHRAPFFNSFGYVVEAIPAFRMQETVMLSEFRSSVRHANGVSPVYMKHNDRIFTVAAIKTGENGEIFIETRDEKANAFEFSDDLPEELTVEDLPAVAAG